jgi:hypothetical protein
MKAVMASLGIVAALATWCWGQEPPPEDGQLSRTQLEAAVLEARQAALEAREAARAAHLALEQSQGAVTVEAEGDTMQDRRWRKAVRSSEHRRARIESQRWRGQAAARPTVYVDALNFLSFPKATPQYYHGWITRTYSPYPPAVVVPVQRHRSYYSWYSY